MILSYLCSFSRKERRFGERRGSETRLTCWPSQLVTSIRLIQVLHGEIPEKRLAGLVWISLMISGAENSFLLMFLNWIIWLRAPITWMDGSILSWKSWSSYRRTSG